MRMKAILPLSMLATTVFAQGNLQTGISRENMDLQAKPGTDFYDYATGGWRKAHPLTAEYASYSQFESLQENNQEQLKQLILELSGTPQEKGSLGQKIGSLYKLAMDSVRLNKEGWEPIRPTYERIRAVKSKTEFILLSGELGRIGVPSLFYIGCDADYKNSAMNLVTVSQGGISLGDRSFYLEEDEAMARIREAYKAYVKKLFMMVGSSEAEAERDMKSVLAIETRIAQASYSAAESRDVEKNYHKMSYASLLEDYSGIDWSTLFLQLGYPAFNEICISQPEPIHEVEKILAESSVDDLKAYLAFKFVNDAASSLSDDFREAYFDFYSRTMRGAQEDRPRWKRAVGVVNGVLGEAVGKMYVEKYFPETSKQKMIGLVKNLQAALADRINAQTWMCQDTKEKAIDKLNNFRVKIGYPERWMDYSGLLIDENLSYYENLCRASEFLNSYEISKTVNKPVDQEKWYMTPQTINAYYNPTTNEICFPAGILQPPFFNPEADDACNYGAIGVVIGHEMTHGFDDQGSLFDKNGNLSGWWTEADRAGFAKRTQVMADYFSKIEALPGTHVNGKLTLGENIADHGGLNVAFDALKTAMKANPLSTVDGFTPEQRFFLSYGLMWAGNMRDERLRQLVKTDPHSPARWRVNGALPHIDEWYKAFKVTKKDPLFLPKSKRVNIW